MGEPKDDERDVALLARIANRDMAAMRALYLAHAEAVQRFVQARLRDRTEVADIVHETMLSAWRSAAGFEGRASVRAWLLSLARNKTVDHIRRQARVTLAEPDETVPLDEPDAAAAIAAAQDAARVRDCVAKLPERQRAVVHLAFFEELSYPEIAGIENVPVGTVKSRMFHARKLLLLCLSGLRERVNRPGAPDDA